MPLSKPLLASNCGLDELVAARELVCTWLTTLWSGVLGTVVTGTNSNADVSVKVGSTLPSF